jgi:hypothetical protein
MFKKLMFLFLISFQALSVDARCEDLIKNISHIYQEVMEFIVGISGSQFKEGLPIDFEKRFKDHFETLLNERFTVVEKKQIAEAIRKAGGEKIVAMARIMVETISQKMTPDNKLEDIKVVLSGKYEQTLEKVCEEKNIKENLRNAYLKYFQEKNLQKSLDEADAFVRLAIKYLKKTIADNFSEEEFCSWYDFEHSELGKRLQNVLLESMALSSQPKGK